jgi:flagellar hook-basal body complex protein FliE
MVGLLNAAGAITGSQIGAAGIQNSPLQNAKQVAAPAPFADLITDAVGQVNQLESQAQTAVSGLMTGSGVDVHTAMIATEKANMTFELALGGAQQGGAGVPVGNRNAILAAGFQLLAGGDESAG